MGIKPSYIKTMGEALLEQHRESFNGNFDDNKKVVSEVTTIQSTTIRNRVAGNITRKINTSQRRRSILITNTIHFLPARSPHLRSVRL